MLTRKQSSNNHNSNIERWNTHHEERSCNLASGNNGKHAKRIAQKCTPALTHKYRRRMPVPHEESQNCSKKCKRKECNVRLEIGGRQRKRRNHHCANSSHATSKTVHTVEQFRRVRHAKN